MTLLEATATPGPWDLLARPGAVPRLVDAQALASGGVTLTDPRRGAALARWLLVRAARDGHTWLPSVVVVAALDAFEVPDIGASLRLAEDIVAPQDGTLALMPLVRAEDDLAEALVGLTLMGVVVHCVAGPRCAERAAAAAAAGAGRETLLIDDAERLTLDDLRDAVVVLSRRDDLDEGSAVVLAGDDALLGAPGPGSGFRDLVDALPTTRVAPQPGLSPLDRLREHVRLGRLPAPEGLGGPEHSVVVVGAADDTTAARRVGQLVELSIPRGFGVASRDVRVVSMVRRGGAGTVALEQLLGRPVTLAADVPVDAHCVAAVVVVPAAAAGMLARDGFLTALQGISGHVSVVTLAGSALARAVSVIAHRPRRTRLASLLHEDPVS